jgi:type II secretion system protein H
VRRALGRRAVAAFTLIEALVALAIAAAVAALVLVAAAPADASLAEREARRLGALLELALAEARASGRAIAWSREPDGYAFWQESSSGEWTAFPKASPYRRRALPARVDLREARVDAIALAPGERIVLRPHGLSARLSVTLAAGGELVVLRGTALGPMSLQRLHAH